MLTSLSRFRRLLAAVLLGAIFLAPAQAQMEGLDVGVRAKAAQPLKNGMKFVIYPAVEAAAVYKLVRPVDATTLASMYRLLQEKLVAGGFVAVGEKEKPEILITLQYGRGYLLNPYRTGTHTSDVDGISAVSVVGLPDMKRLDLGREAKRQDAEHEKLFMTVTAWEFATMQKGMKPRKLWETVMNVDDPDHRDLTQIYKQMITAGADYFNRSIEQEEVAISTSVREGRVEIGTPHVVPDAKPPAK